MLSVCASCSSLRQASAHASATTLHLFGKRAWIPFCLVGIAGATNARPQDINARGSLSVSTLAVAPGSGLVRSGVRHRW